MKLSVSDLPDDQYAGRNVFVRVDFNVPISNGRVEDDYRIRMALPTIQHLLERKAKVILASHLGRPKGKAVSEMSLKPAAQRLSEILGGRDVKFIGDCVGDKVVKAAQRLGNGEVLLLENLRFHKEEEENDSSFSDSLASLAEIYVNDAFSTSHRKHASICGMTRAFDQRIAGLLLRKELAYLTRVRDAPNRPFTLIIGGVKIKDKITALKNLVKKADKILIGGAVAYTFLTSMGIDVGDSLIEEDLVEWAGKVLSENGEKILLPEDHVVASSMEEKGRIVMGRSIQKGVKGFDLGPSTALKYANEVARSRGTIFWNGPMGVFETDEFSRGTINVAMGFALAYWRGATTVVGGGDTVACLARAGVSENEATHISTGGGASLEYLGGAELPGIAALTDKE